MSVADAPHTDVAVTSGATTGQDETASGRRLRRAVILALIAVIAVAPLAIYPIFLMKLMCFALFACAFNLLLGYVGLLSFGHAAFFGMGSYLAAYSAKTWGLPPELAVLSGTTLAVVMGFAFGAIAIRRQGIYFAMITLALAQMTYFFSIQTPAFTGGEDGVQGAPRGKLLGLVDLNDNRALYVVVAVVFILSLLFIQRVIRSPFGQVMRAIRDNQTRAISLGYKVDTYKLLAFVLSAGLAGLAGSMKAIVFQVATLNDVHWSMSGVPVIMTLVGGLGTMFGPVVGAIVFVTMENYLTYLGSWVMVIEGFIFFVCVLFFRQGLLGIIPKRWRRWL